jgi:colanic acid biosynthesis glycosyl transferase WcaI
MRVGILTQYYPPEMGAPQARLSQLARELVLAGDEVWVLTAMPNYPGGRIYPGYRGLIRREKIEGAQVIRTAVYPTKSCGTVKRLASYFSFVASSAIVGSWALPVLDYLIVESPPLFLGASGYWLSWLKHARCIFNVSDLWPESAVRLGLLRDGWSLRASLYMEALWYRRAWLVTGQSRGILASIRTRFPAVPTFHFSNGVDTLKFSPDKESKAVRESLALPGVCVVIYAGLHGVAQGLEQILEAAALLRGRNLFFVFLGEGPEKERLMASAKDMQLDNVRFLGPQPPATIPQLLSSADIAVVTLKRWLPGAVPSKLYEAFGAGKPVVFAGEGEGADLVTETGAGRVVASGDAGALAAALLELANDSELRSRMGAAGRRAATTLFNRDAIASGFIAHLRRAAPTGAIPV